MNLPNLKLHHFSTWAIYLYLIHLPGGDLRRSELFRTWMKSIEQEKLPNEFQFNVRSPESIIKNYLGRFFHEEVRDIFLGCDQASDSLQTTFLTRMLTGFPRTIKCWKAAEHKICCLIRGETPNSPKIAGFFHRVIDPGEFFDSSTFQENT